MSEEAQETGHIKFVHGSGFAFISPDSGGRDVYVPRTLAGTFHTGQRVRFTAVQGTKSRVAVTVEPLGRGR